MSYQVVGSLIAAYATNQRINAYLIANVPDAVWREKQPGKKGRDIASMVGHMHNVRLLWLKACGKAAVIPAKLEGDAFSKDEAAAALEESWRALESVLREALSGDGRVKGFSPMRPAFSLTCWPTTRTIVAKSRCLRGNWDIRFRKAPCSDYGSGERGKGKRLGGSRRSIAMVA